MILFYQLYFISATGKIFKGNTGNIGYMKRLTQSTIMTVMIPVWESDLMGESFDIQTLLFAADVKLACVEEKVIITLFSVQRPF